MVETIKRLKVDGIDQASAEGSVPYDPQSNGAAESAVGLLKGTVRALQLGLEKQIGARIPANHPLLTWLVRHAAYTRTARVRGDDGLTPYQRVKGRTTSGPKLVGFGESCRFKNRSHEPLSDNLTSRWHEGHWLGIDTKNGQYIYIGMEPKLHMPGR